MPNDTAKNLGVAAVIAGLVMPICAALTLAIGNAKIQSPHPDVTSEPLGLGGYILLAGMCAGPIVALALSFCSLKTTAGKIGLALGILELAVLFGIGCIIAVLMGLGAIQLP